MVGLRGRQRSLTISSAFWIEYYTNVTEGHRIASGGNDVTDGAVLEVMWEELVGDVRHRKQLIVCSPRLSENALLVYEWCGLVKT